MSNISRNLSKFRREERASADIENAFMFDVRRSIKASWTVTTYENGVKRVQTGECRSFLKQFASILQGFVSLTSALAAIPVKNTAGTTVAIGPAPAPGSSYAASLGISADAGFTSYRTLSWGGSTPKVYAGTDATAVKSSDYRVGAGTVILASIQPPSIVADTASEFSFVAQGIVTSPAGMTINDVGLSMDVTYGGTTTPTFTPVLLVRDVLSTPLVLSAGGQATVSFTIRFLADPAACYTRNFGALLCNTLARSATRLGYNTTGATFPIVRGSNGPANATRIRVGTGNTDRTITKWGLTGSLDTSAVPTTVNAEVSDAKVRWVTEAPFIAASPVVIAEAGVQHSQMGDPSMAYGQGTNYTVMMVTAKLPAPLSLQTNDMIAVKFTHEIAV